MSNWDDDIRIGNEELLGESHRGLQDQYLGAAQALNQLRGALGQLAQGRTTQHLPLTRQLRSPYKDSTQIGIKATATGLTDASFAGTSNPTATGKTRVYKSFKPAKVVVTELVKAVFAASGESNVTKYAKVQGAQDIVLITAFSGADNCFPNAPSDDEGIDCETFANNALGVGISWPTINGGIDMTVGFSVQGSVLAQVAAPDGFELDHVDVTIRMTLLGPSLR